jgi:hypothetical protein
MTQAEREASAQSKKAFNGAICLSCQRSEGGYLSWWYKKR